MKGLHSWLFRRANEAVQAAQIRAEQLKKQIAEAEQRKVEAESALELAVSAIDRFDRFDPIIGDDLQCPYCWIADGVRSKLAPIPNDTNIDWFRCKTCQSEISTK